MEQASVRNRDARIAGFLYLLAIVVGFAALDYLPGKLINADQFLFRVAIVSDLVLGIVWLAVVLSLYRLLKEVDEAQAALMVILGAFMQVPLYFVNAINYAGAFLATDPRLVTLFLRLHHYELLASLVFGGLWLFPFGILVYKSGFLPRTLGVWLVLNGFAWLAISFTGFLAPQYSVVVSNVTFPLTLGEIAITFWLIIFGARVFRASASRA
jgi:hypothetical protein